jgi:Family of unknown function (DUF5990)
VRIRIEGSDLPGRRGGAQADALRLGGVHVGVQCKAEVVDRVAADAAEAAWSFEVTSREVDGLLDVGGPWVHGRPGARFLYLSWGAVTGDEFAMFRRAKLMFGDIPTDLLRAAHEAAAHEAAAHEAAAHEAAAHKADAHETATGKPGGTLVGRLGLTDAAGGPVCARVRPPAITWTVE